MDDNRSNNGAGNEGQAQANAVRHPINTQAAVGEQAGGDTYMECRRNVSIHAGCYTVDGCREFLKGAADENAMLCAACGCHRSFHRKVVFPNHFRIDNTAHNLLFKDIPFVRPVPQTVVRPRFPLFLIPPLEMTYQSESEEEMSESDEESEERSELDSESEDDEEVEMINEDEKTTKNK